jgi:hypothetical protein
MKPDWSAKLPTLDVGALKMMPVGSLKQPWDGKIEVEFGDGESDVTPDHGYHSPVLKRSTHDLRAVNNHALEHMMNLPGPGEAYHFLVGDKLSLWDIVPALIERIAPRPIRALHVSTLSFGAATAADILALLDAGKIQRISFLVSVMFSAKNRHLYDQLVPHLLKRGHRAGAMRTHAKILAIDLGKGERYVVESSSNLRTCHCCEQTTIIRDDGLFHFHREWMDRALGIGEAKAAR